MTAPRRAALLLVLAGAGMAGACGWSMASVATTQGPTALVWLVLTLGTGYATGHLLRLAREAWMVQR